MKVVPGTEGFENDHKREERNRFGQTSCFPVGNGAYLLDCFSESLRALHWFLKHVALF